MSLSNNQDEDLAIQHTLSMTTDQRLGLIANLIAEKISQDSSKGKSLIGSFNDAEHARSNYSF